MTFTEPRAFIYFVSTVTFSIVDATQLVFDSVATRVVSASAVDAAAVVGPIATGGGCHSSNSIVLRPEQGFPGASPGNC
jgi:hypothetical protein